MTDSAARTTKTNRLIAKLRLLRLGASLLLARKSTRINYCRRKCFRLTFSHGDHAFHTTYFTTVRTVSEELGIPVAVLQISGPKIRITEIDGDYAQMCHGSRVELFGN
jgi:hypothetical protein